MGRFFLTAERRSLLERAGERLTLAIARRSPDPRKRGSSSWKHRCGSCCATIKLHAEDAALTARSQQLESELEALKQDQATQTQTLKTQGQDIQTVEAKSPSPPTVITSMLNGRPLFASQNGRFSLTLRTVMQLDTAAYFQDPVGPIATDLRRSGPALGASAANVDAAHAR